MRANGSVYRIADMIGNKNTEAGPPNGPFYRAVPSPFHGGISCRIRGAWEVLRGTAYATDWPERGDLEKALNK